MPSKKKKYNLPKGYSLFQTTTNSKAFLEDPIAFISKSMTRYAETYSASLGINRKIILTKNPRFIHYILKENHKNYQKSELATERAVKFFGNGLLFSNGQYWLKQRRLIQPAFHKNKIEGLFAIVVKSINDFLTTFPTGPAIDVYPIVHKLSFEILIKSLFDIHISSKIMEEMSTIFSEVQTFLLKDVNKPLHRIFYPITGEEKMHLKKARRVRSIFVDIIQERRTSQKEFTDLLDMLLNSKYEDTGESMTDEQITDELLILIFAGHETTANSLSWILYLIANNKKEHEKLLKSIATISIQECMQNEFLKATIHEGIRLYPAAWMTERVALDDDEFEGISYPKKTIIIPFFFGLHREEKLWKEATKFNPDRFLDNPKMVKSNNYFPFGAGPRMCIGNNFAMAEMTFFLFLFLKEFTIAPTTALPIMNPLITLRPDKVILEIKRKLENN